MTRNRNRPSDARPRHAPFQPEILWQEEDALVVNKPAGLAAHDGARLGRNLVDELRLALGREVYPVHRLDRDTSGAMLLALTPEASRKWGERLESGEKKYLTVSSGRFRGGRFIVDSPLSHNGRTFDAKTGFKVLRSFGPFTLLEAMLFTGRTHQVRLHLAGLQKPILGDDKYGDFDLNKSWAKRLGKPRLFLHAAELKVGGIHVFAPLPPWWGDLFKIYNATLEHPSFRPEKRRAPPGKAPGEAESPESA